MFEDSLEIILSTIEECYSDIRLLECSDIVGSISSHESNESEGFESRENELLLNGRYSGVNPSVLNEDVPLFGSIGVLLECGSGHTDIVFVEE